MSTFESAALSSNCPIKLRRIRVRFQFFKVVVAAAQRESAAAQTKNAATNALEVPIKQQQANAATTQAGAAVTSAGAHVTTANGQSCPGLYC